MIKVFLALALLFVVSPLHNNNLGIKQIIDAEIACLTMNMYHEAGSESKQGKIAVGNVTMNRMKNNNFPRTVCGVITQSYKGACQFSWFCSGKVRQIPQTTYNELNKLAKKIYFGEIRDITGGALFFHNHEVSPEWAAPEKMTVEIGNHKFYRK